MTAETAGTFAKAYSDYISFYSKIADAFADSYAAMVDIYLQDRGSTSTSDLERKTMAKARDIFNDRFREQDFLRSISEVTEAFSELVKTTGFGQIYQNVSNMYAVWNNLLIEPLRDTMFRTPSHKVHTEGSFSLFHYDRMTAMDKFEMHDAPLLVVYAFINRHYILDLLPQISVIRSLMQQGLNTYATDWGTPGAYDKELTIGHYVNNYLDSAVDNIIKHTNTDKVSLLGYCWGGDITLMYASIHPEKVKNVVTFATPGDFALDNGLLALWTRSTNADAIVDAFGNAPSMLLNSAFALRSPIDYLHKYPHFFFEKQRDLQSIIEFFATEMWLYDSPPVIGEIYRQFVNDCYKKNLLIQNKMTIGNNTRIDLRNVKAPYLNIVASNDDLVEPESSKALNKAVGTPDSSLIEFKSGHVGACISANAHRDLWPRVGQWLKEHA